MDSLVDKAEKRKIANRALQVASSSQDVSLTRVMKSRSEIKKLFYEDPEGGPEGSQESFPLAFTVPGQKRIFINTDKLFRGGDEEFPEEAIYFLICHEAGHLSLTPIYMKGDILEILAIIHQPKRDIRFPLPAIEVIKPHSIRNRYQDSLINYNILHNRYIENRPEIRRKIAEGAIYTYEEMGNSVTDSESPPRSVDLFLDVSYQSARKVLHDMGVSPYDSEGYTKEDVLNKLDELDFRFGESNRPEHNAKLAEYIWWLRFEFEAEELVNKLDENNFERWANNERKMREAVMKEKVRRKYAKMILKERDKPVPERHIGRRKMEEVSAPAQRRLNEDYEEYYPDYMEKFSELIGFRKWEDVKDSVLGAGASIP